VIVRGLCDIEHWAAMHTPTSPVQVLVQDLGANSALELAAGTVYIEEKIAPAAVS
jgi:hypothetical protein